MRSGGVYTWILAAMVLALLLIGVPALVVLSNAGARQHSAGPSPEESAPWIESEPSSEPSKDTGPRQQAVDDSTIRLYINGEDRVISLPLTSYLEGVVAAEMPASFPLEALKAQAVSARTYTLRSLQQPDGGCPLRPDADFCSDPEFGQAWMSDEALRDRWGWFNWLRFSRKIKRAVDQTQGMLITYQGQPIDALYHSTSGGRTADPQYVWGNAVPYLQSVKSPYEEMSPYWRQTVRIPLPVFTEKLGLPPGILKERVARGQLIYDKLTQTPSGRVDRIQFGDRVFSGPEFRQQLDLPSTWLTLSVEANDVVIETRGYGHGVGMSQYGARGMAEQGHTAVEILEHYYTSVEIMHK